jgi:hypothetical protein
MNEHWTRWIHASISKYFKDLARPKSLVLWIEAEETTQKDKDAPDRVEIRWDGPYATQLTRKEWRLNLELNGLITSVANRDDAYAHKKVVGLVQAMITDIPVYRYGTLLDIDDKSYLGCLQLRADSDREAIITSYFGKMESQTPIEQSTVEAHYRMNLKIQEPLS